MVSPFVRRRRLAAELVKLREEHDCSAQRLAGEIGVTRQSISRLENGHVAPDLNTIMKILTRFSVDQHRWNQIMTIARHAQERGWWATYADQMGPRQALYANLEAGAASIHEYHLTFLPGLLQIPPYTEARLRADRDTHAHGRDFTQALEARAARQQALRRPGGPSYHVIIDEAAVRRFAVPADVVAAQLDHLVDTGHHHDNVTIQVLPINAAITGAVPRSAFFTYRYPDPADPVVVAVDTITSDLVLLDNDKPDDVRRYIGLYEHLQTVALCPADSLDFLAATAEELTKHRRHP